MCPIATAVYITWKVFHLYSKSSSLLHLFVYSRAVQPMAREPMLAREICSDGSQGAPGMTGISPEILHFLHFHFTIIVGVRICSCDEPQNSYTEFFSNLVLSSYTLNTKVVETMALAISLFG